MKKGEWELWQMPQAWEYQRKDQLRGVPGVFSKGGIQTPGDGVVVAEWADHMVYSFIICVLITHAKNHLCKMGSWENTGFQFRGWHTYQVFSWNWRDIDCSNNVGS